MLNFISNLTNWLMLRAETGFKIGNLLSNSQDSNGIPSFVKNIL